MDVKTAESLDGKSFLINNKCKYWNLGKLSCSELEWRCTAKNCNSSLYTVGDNLVRRTINCNNHEPLSIQKLSRKLVSNLMNRKAEKD